MSVIDHKKEAQKSVGCMIITVSDTRTEESDKSGKLMMELLKANGHEIILYRIVKDDWQSIKDAILDGCEHSKVEVILTNGGTGMAKRDVTIETVQSLISKEMVGFGEIFRMLSFTEDIGSAAILSRAMAGVVQDKAIFATPGSSGAVKLAMNRLILPEIGHVVREIQKDLV